jgi:hypothetical protein
MSGSDNETEPLQEEVPQQKRDTEEARRPEGLQHGVPGSGSQLDPVRRLVLRWRREFLELTGVACRDAHEGLDAKKLQAWQRAHGLEPTGILRRDTLEVARRKTQPTPPPARAGAPAVDDTTAEAATELAPSEPATASAALPDVLNSTPEALAKSYPVEKVPPSPKGASTTARTCRSPGGSSSS